MSNFTNLDALLSKLPVSADSKIIEVNSKRVKFMLVGTHTNQTTGYSKVTHNLIHELAKYPCLDIYHFAFQNFVKNQQPNRVYPPNVDVFDPFPLETDKSEQGFGFSELPGYIQKVKPDYVMIYNDASIICRFLDKLPANPAERTYKLIIYLDQVYTIQRPEFLDRINKDADIYFAFTNYWREILQRQGITKPIYVLRHGFEPEVFKPLNRTAMRKKHNIPEHLFLFLNLNRNTPRKRHDIVVKAFAELVARHPTKPLALLAVCDNGQQGGYPLHEIFARELIQLGLSPQHHGHKLMLAQHSMMWEDQVINELYALSDVGITAADGEGFGLCQFEAMGIGIPQVVPYIGGFRDFCIPNKNAMCVVPKFEVYLPLALSVIGGKEELVDHKDLALAAEDYLLDTDLRMAHGKAARETVLGYRWADEVKNLVDVLTS
jgi:glycosyltransferase involved in cell wall biosynthesis